MRCRDARDLMLQADPDELTGEGAGALASHLRSCAACATAAARIARAQMDLARSLDGIAAGTDPIAAARRAWTAGPAKRRWPVAALVPLAAAAAAVVILVLRDADVPEWPPGPPAPEAMTLLEVEVASTNRTAAVMRTANPDIVVVWFF